MGINAVGTFIRVVRGHRVLFDRDLAALYGVSTKALNLAVRRNVSRFPDDFMFQLTPGEAANLRFQIETSSWGGRRHLPHAFTEQGVAMISGLLRSGRAIQANIAIMRAFVRMRHAFSTRKLLSGPFKRLENWLLAHDATLGKHAKQLGELIAVLDEMMDSDERKKKIGFSNEELR